MIFARQSRPVFEIQVKYDIMNALIYTAYVILIQGDLSMAKKDKKKLNLLDCTPVREPDLTWTEDENGIVTLHREHSGLTDRIVHKVTKRPLRQTHVELEAFGSFLWKVMDGRTTLRDLADKLKNEFGESVEPLYPRLNQYVVSLKNNKLIFWKLPEKNDKQE